MGTLPVRSNLCTPLIALSTAVRNKVSKTVSERRLLMNNSAAKQLIHPSMRAQFHLHPFHLSWALPLELTSTLFTHAPSPPFSNILCVVYLVSTQVLFLRCVSPLLFLVLSLLVLFESRGWLLCMCEARQSCRTGCNKQLQCLGLPILMY